MADIELDSFVRKFKLLRDAGYEASLSFNTSLGEVHINLSCKVGRVVPPPPSPPAQMVSSSQKYRSPSYYRRQARRRAQRESLPDTNVNVADEVKDDVVEPAEEVIHDLALSNDASVTEVEDVEAATEYSGMKDASESSSSEEEDNGDVEIENEDDLGVQLKAIIHESKLNREKWDRRNDVDDNG